MNEFIAYLMLFLSIALLLGVGIIIGTIIGELRMVKNKKKYDALRKEWAIKESIKLRAKAKKSLIKADYLDEKAQILNQKATSLDRESGYDSDK